MKIKTVLKMSKSKRSNNHQPIRVAKSLYPSSQRYRSNPYSIFAKKGNAVTLIRFYAGHECLWNRESEDYFNQNKKQALWEWIARQFGGKLTRHQVEYEAKFLHKQALQELNRIHRFQENGLPRKSNFELLNEFWFLMPNAQLKEGCLGFCQSTAENNLQTKNKTQDQDDLTEFCNRLREELSQLPSYIRLHTQKKILLIMQRSKGGVDQTLPDHIVPEPSNKFVNWNLASNL